MKTAEDIIIAKRFFELTPAEREAVKELVSNEEDYEAMRWFLMSTGKAFADEKISPSSDLRKNVMAHLQQKQAAPKTIWLNSAGAFLFPADKKFYQYPALQIAAVAALIVSIVVVYQNNAPINSELAVNDVVVNPQQNENLNPASEVYSSQPVESEQQTALEEGDKVSATKMQMDELSEDLELLPMQEQSYYREMSVAEEVKFAEKYDSDEKEANILSDKPDNFLGANTSTGSSVPADSKVTTQVELKNVVSKKESDDSKLSGKDKSNKVTSDGNANPNRAGNLEQGVAGPPAGYTTTNTAVTTESEDLDGNLYKTGTAGGIYGDTAADSVTVNNTEAEGKAKTKYSVTDSKRLKKLFFSVK